MTAEYETAEYGQKHYFIGGLGPQSLI